ncbi:hypothetical protein ACFSTH_08075 [Paenibacillus yanchengensis]|uniref:Uncharacterized protein n=1 Tax=Paenibacillus yanchengensis TaxID=2035833 RepID=A0ABW4YL46_9BACL
MMSEKILKQILEKLNHLDDRISSIEETMNSIKADTSDIPLIRRATLESLELIKESDKKTASTLNTHEFGIDILNREQLKLKTDIEMLKNR